MADSLYTRNKVFISHSKADSEWAERLKAHLDSAYSKGLVESWSDRELQLGSEWKKEIQKAINSAKVAVLFLSPDYFASDFIAYSELPLLKQAAREGTLLLPIVVRHVEQNEHEGIIGSHEALNHKPIVTLPPRDQERLLIESAKRIYEVIDLEPPTRKVPSGLSGKVLASAIGGAVAGNVVGSIVGGVLLSGIGSLLIPVIGALVGGVVAAASKEGGEE